MADGTSIEWTQRPGTKGASWNPVRARDRLTGKVGWHCTHDSEGCRFCYAEGFNLRLGTGLAYKPGHERDIEIFLDQKTLQVPLRWKAPRTIFCGSMTDLFGQFVSDEMLDKIFAVAALCPQHTFIFLTKRADRMRRYLSSADRPRLVNGQIWSALGTPRGSKIVHNGNWRCSLPLPNVWLGVSTEDQAAADRRIPELLATPAAVRFVSAEPLLGPINLESKLGGTRWIGGQRGCDGRHQHAGMAGEVIHGVLHKGDPRRPHHHHDDRCAPGLDWVIVGGESGRNARPMHPDWARDLSRQCFINRVPFFFKQWGEWVSVSCREGQPVAWHEFPDGACVKRLSGGKKAAGRLLDGVEHSEFPTVVACQVP
ncbi:DUF5131 family protein [Mesorhizobium muleiense]|uniref:DUF5131 family protein n=1 Tax=Mesorhizobium muleiense TaxID=1004279 RepID=UPI001F33A309|nr:phage Gp37/Gp68 family protein [Mesorhizobium muleiense]MCF6112361.1 phage Gp37/Gp68 family protein [Mesorhizobium muleiense]